MSEQDFTQQIAASWAAAQPLRQARVLDFSGSVTQESANDLCAHLLLLDRLDHTRPIQLRLNSPGGVVYAGLAVYDVLRHLRASVATVAIGQVAGVAALLLMAGKPGQRFAMATSTVHYTPLRTPAGGMASDIVIAKREVQRLAGVLQDIAKTHTRAGGLGQLFAPSAGFTQERTFTAQEAVRYRIVDAVVQTADEVGG